ncbi:MAG: hypothetical protein O7F76_01885, partial [Planctomycetota bacterium]|nr:hypothetical protein [Planctomycetota bacterium]
LIMEGGRIQQCGTVGQVVGRKDDNRCQYEMTLARAVPEVAETLEGIDGLDRVEVHGREVTFEYEHDEGAAANLLRLLFERGLPVARFSPVEHDLEQAYLRTGIRQVN